ncbi:cation diffusion facilitator family transporter [Nocardioides sp. DS6]|uniref:Cation diffusion facilitator family transporter n=1 Tax=Nocardioides eburneus TaxID=3231482 RepID=A0ABV3SW18_9ACTN
MAERSAGPGLCTGADHPEWHDDGRGHGEGHGHQHGHDHRLAADADRRYLSAALVLLSAFMVGEIVAAVLAGSLALLADAGHMLADVGALAGALWALHLAARPASGPWTYGWKRAEILSAAVNGITLLVVAGIVTVEAVRRLAAPPHVEGGPVLVVALVGCAVNIAASWLLARANRTSLNVEGAYQHVLTDLYGFLGTAAAAVVILLTGWTRADSVASLVVVVLMAYAGGRLLRDSGRILLERAPDDVDLEELRRHLLEVPHVHEVHDLHVWTVTSDLPTLSAHLTVDDSCFLDGHAPQLLDEVQACLQGHFDVAHSTFQLEPATHAEHEPGMH